MARNDDSFDVEGIEVDKLTEAEKAIYDKLHGSFRNSWLKKNDKAAKEAQKRDADYQKLQSDLNEAHTALAAYYDWYQSIGQNMTPQQQDADMDRRGLEDPSDLQREIRDLRSSLQQVMQTNSAWEKKFSEIESNSGQTRGMLDLALKLNELRYKHKGRDVDLKRVIDVMNEKQIKDPDLAYNLAYDDELRRETIDKEVNTRVEEERQKLVAERDLVDKSAAESHYLPPAEPKSYSEASQALLEKIRTGG